MGSVTRFRALDLADLLTSGTVGQELTDALKAHFGSIGRGDVFTALRLAVATWTADILEAQLERDAARAEAATTRMDLDTAQIRLGCYERQFEVMRGEGAWLNIARMPDPAMTGAAHG